MKTINIYLTKQNKTKADKLRIKYKVSLSTIASIVSFSLLKYINLYNQNELEKLKTEYIVSKQASTTYKTSIKPRNFTKGSYLGDMLETNRNCFVSNALLIYLEGLIKNYLNPQQSNKYYAEIDKNLQETFDTYWDYNANIRNQRRMMRQNKEYWKKVLEDA